MLSVEDFENLSLKETTPSRAVQPQGVWYKRLENAQPPTSLHPPKECTEGMKM